MLHTYTYTPTQMLTVEGRHYPLPRFVREEKRGQPKVTQEASMAKSEFEPWVSWILIQHFNHYAILLKVVPL